MSKKGGLSYASKADANQAEIVDQLRGMGFDVDVVHRLPKLYDLVVSGIIRRDYQCVAVRVEVKVPGGTMTPDEKEYWQKQNHPANLIRAESADDVLRWFGYVK